MCDFYASCKAPSEFIVINKAVGKRPEFRVNACFGCASRIGSKTPEGPLINSLTRECSFYKIIPLNS